MGKVNNSVLNGKSENDILNEEGEKKKRIREYVWLKIKSLKRQLNGIM